MPSGGYREGSGRPKGAIGKMSAMAVLQAKATGELPHEFLLRIVRGRPIDGQVPTLEQRMSAAIAAAPYFSPKLAAIEQRVHSSIRAVVSNRPMTTEEFAARYLSTDKLLPLPSSEEGG